MIDKVLEHVKFYAKDCAGFDIDGLITIILLQIKVPSGHEGFLFLRRAILLYRENPTRKFMKDIYPEVGSYENCIMDGQHVDQAIRRVISVAWKNADKEVLEIFFQTNADGFLMKPSNVDFIMQISIFIDMVESFRRESLAEELNLLRR